MLVVVRPQLNDVPPSRDESLEWTERWDPRSSNLEASRCREHVWPRERELWEAIQTVPDLQCIQLLFSSANPRANHACCASKFLLHVATRKMKGYCQNLLMEFPCKSGGHPPHWASWADPSHMISHCTADVAHDVLHSVWRNPSKDVWASCATHHQNWTARVCAEILMAITARGQTPSEE